MSGSSELKASPATLVDSTKPIILNDYERLESGTSGLIILFSKTFATQLNSKYEQLNVFPGRIPHQTSLPIPAKYDRARKQALRDMPMYLHPKKPIPTDFKGFYQRTIRGWKHGPNGSWILGPAVWQPTFIVRKYASKDNEYVAQMIWARIGRIGRTTSNTSIRTTTRPWPSITVSSRILSTRSSKAITRHSWVLRGALMRLNGYRRTQATR